MHLCQTAFHYAYPYTSSGVHALGCLLACVYVNLQWPERYVPLFGDNQYDASKIRPDTVPIEEQLRALEEVVKAGKVRPVH